MRYFLPIIALCFAAVSSAQSFYFGNDLSYVNQMEDCGAIFKEGNQPKNVYQIFADHGTNLVRVRLWVDPSWWQSPLVQPAGVRSFYSDLEDVKETISRSKSAGMQVMLDLHFSDFWADPGRQLIPRSWLNVAYDLAGLKDSVYNYTFNVLSSLNKAGLMPEIVKIGNENNGGILVHIPEAGGYNPAETVSTSWSRHAQLYNSAIKAIRDVGATASINPKIAVHFTNKLSGQLWNFSNLISHGVTDFDIMGISYYYAWHGGSIGELESTIKSLVSRFPSYKVMVVETGYLWSTLNYDQMPNIINEPDPAYLPVIPEKQLEYMIDYSRAVMRGGGIGVVFWEPAWVSTPCRTPWGLGSSHDHVVFFDPENTNFMKNGGGRWTELQNYKDIYAKKVIFKVDMTGEDVSNGVYITGDFTAEPGKIIPMANEGNGIYSYFTYLPQGDSGHYLFLNGNTPDAGEILPGGCSANGNADRDYKIEPSGNIFINKWETCNGNITAIDNKLPDYQNITEINVYPNPNNGTFFLTYSTKVKNPHIDLLDYSGKLLHSYSRGNNSGQAEIRLPEGLDNLYILKFSDGDNVIYKKLIIMNAN